MRFVRAGFVAAVSCALLVAGCGGTESTRQVKSTAQAEYTVCPMYCIDGDAACVLDDGSCEFACNSCLCESVGGQWNPGTSCP
jgi:hypothetical protein